MDETFLFRTLENGIKGLVVDLTVSKLPHEVEVYNLSVSQGHVSDNRVDRGNMIQVNKKKSDEQFGQIEAIVAVGE